MGKPTFPVPPGGKFHTILNLNKQEDLTYILDRLKEGSQVVDALSRDHMGLSYVAGDVQVSFQVPKDKKEKS